MYIKMVNSVSAKYYKKKNKERLLEKARGRH